MTTDNIEDALQQILASFRNPESNADTKPRPRLTMEQDRIKAILETEQDYSVLRNRLESELASFKVRIAANDALTGAEDTVDKLRETFDMQSASLNIEMELRKPEPFYGETILEIEVPSGKLVIADSLTPVLTPEAVGDFNYGRGQHDTTLKYAKDYHVASAFVGNSCPKIVQQTDGIYLVVSLDVDEKDEDIYENGETEITTVITDSWSVELTDYQNWLNHGGQELADGYSHVYDVINVVKGKYRWTVKSHADGWSHYDFPRAEFATLELIEAY
jgi:hypothetical protein